MMVYPIGRICSGMMLDILLIVDLYIVCVIDVKGGRCDFDCTAFDRLLTGSGVV